MKVYKCDRCGKYFDTYEAYVIFKDIENTSLDLCSECVQDFKKWVNDGRRKSMIKYSDEDITTFDPNKRIDISEGLDPKTGEWGHNS